MPVKISRTFGVSESKFGISGSVIIIYSGIERKKIFGRNVTLALIQHHWDEKTTKQRTSYGGYDSKIHGSL